MKSNFLFLILLISNLGLAQEETTKIPKSIEKSIPKLANYLVKNSTTSEEKVTAIYSWITHNISYDYDLLQKPEHYVGLDPKKTLKKKKALSFDFAELMRALLHEIGIESEIVPGYIHDVHWKAGTRVLSGNHTWLTVNIDGEWTLCDPTWDAGYIGRRLNKPLEYTEKIYTKTSFPTEKKQDRVLQRRAKKEIRRKKKYDAKPLYKDEIGFVRDPQKEYFLIHTDTFLLNHLPIIPMWQFRGNPISVEEFSKDEDTLKYIIDSGETNAITYSTGIESYLEQNYIDQMIFTAEKGTEFNPLDPSIKLIYYYNYMALVHNKNLQRIARGSQYEISPSNYDELNAKTDTIIKYNKIFKDFEKTNYKNIKNFDKEEHKKSVTREKENSKMVQKVLVGYDKLSEEVDKNSKKLKSGIEKITASISKINTDYSAAISYKEPNDLNKVIVMKYLDSILPLVKRIETRILQLKELHDSSSFNSLFKNINTLEYLFRRNEMLIRFNSYSTSDAIRKVDSLIMKTSLNFLKTNADEIPHEFVENELANALKLIENHCKLAKSELNQLETSGKLQYAYKYELYLQSIYHDILEKVRNSYELSLNFNYQIDKALKQFKGRTKAIDKMHNKQLELKEDKYKFIADESELEHKRSDNLVLDIEKTTKKWKSKYHRK